MNSLLSTKIGFGTEIVKTGSAGEHAMSLELVEMLPYASGYALEPPRPHVAAPLKKSNLQKFANVIEEHIGSYSALEGK